MNRLNISITSFICLALLFIIECVNDAPFKFRFSQVPQQLNDGWETGSPESAGFDNDSLNKMYDKLTDESQYYNALGLLIVKDNRLVYETYLHTPEDRDRLHHIQSCTKSFTSIAFGIARAQGYIDSLNQTFCSIYSDKCPDDPAKSTITLYHLLTMTSGIKIDNSVFSMEMHIDKPSDPVRYILNKPLYAQPGDSMYYRDADPQLLAYVIHRLTGKTQEQLMSEVVFKPLNITDYYWEPMPDGETSGPHSLYLKPRDMAKIGQLLLNNGSWNGVAILDSSWIKESTAPHVQNEWQKIIWEYGYLWWVLPEYGAYTASGHGGQFIFVQPHQHLVIVMISMPDTNDDYVGTTLKGFLELVKPLLKKV